MKTELDRKIEKLQRELYWIAGALLTAIVMTSALTVYLLMRG